MTPFTVGDFIIPDGATIDRIEGPIVERTPTGEVDSVRVVGVYTVGDTVRDIARPLFGDWWAEPVATPTVVEVREGK